jgi:hypothetical protein
VPCVRVSGKGVEWTIVEVDVVSLNYQLLTMSFADIMQFSVNAR